MTTVDNKIGYTYCQMRIDQNGFLSTRFFFRIVARINRYLLPSMREKDLTRLSKTQKLIVAWRYWVTKNSL